MLHIYIYDISRLRVKEVVDFFVVFVSVYDDTCFALISLNISNILVKIIKICILFSNI